jgi:hypothetical protein
LINHDDSPDDQEKELHDYLDATPVLESPMNEMYEVPKRRGDEALPPPDLKPLPEELRYEFLDYSNKDPIIISSNLLDKEE